MLISTFITLLKSKVVLLSLYGVNILFCLLMLTKMDKYCIAYF